MTYSWEPEQRNFLDTHRWAVLATGRKDGAPQQSMVGYFVDDDGRLVLSVKSYTAKWHNALRQPSVSITVPDGREHLVINGEAEPIADDPLRGELTAIVLRRHARNSSRRSVDLRPQPRRAAANGAAHHTNAHVLPRLTPLAV